jgi:hypothetical protein
MQILSCYEKLRLENIVRNQQFLEEIGLGSTAIVIPDKLPKRG